MTETATNYCLFIQTSNTGILSNAGQMPITGIGFFVSKNASAHFVSDFHNLTGASHTQNLFSNVNRMV